MRCASPFCESLLAFIASAICQASTSLMATASNSSRLPSPARKSSSVLSLPVLRGRLGLLAVMVASSRFEFTFTPAGQRQVFVRCLPGFLDEPVKRYNSALMHAEPHARNPVARQRTADLP